MTNYLDFEKPLAEIEGKAEELRATITQVASDLNEQGDAGALAAFLLRLAVTTPDGANAIMIDAGRPVLINWGLALPHQEIPAAPVGVAGSPAAMAATDVAASAAGADMAMTTGPAATSGFPRALWAVPVLLFLLLGGLLWHLMQPAPVETVTIVPPAPLAYDPAPDIREHIARLESALLEVKQIEPKFGGLCLSEAEQACAAAKAAPQPKELIIIMDASGSMEYSINTPRWLDLAIYRAWKNQDRSTFQKLVRQAERQSGSSRENVTKSILRSTIRGAAPDISIGMTSFRSCSDRPEFPVTGHQRRGALIDWMMRVRPQGATAIAASIRDAVAMLKGGASADDPVNVLLISDGLDTCDGDPCAAARAAKRAKPGLRINVVDLAGFDSLRCVASATGGLYRSHEDGMSVSELSMVTRSFAGTETTCKE